MRSLILAAMPRSQQSLSGFLVENAGREIARGSHPVIALCVLSLAKVGGLFVPFTVNGEEKSR